MEPLLQTKNFSKKYNTFVALDTISIELKRGEIYGLIGPNGAGKTTLMKCISGLSFPTSGTLSLFGETSLHTIHAKRKKVGCLIENPGFIPNMTAKENMVFFRTMHGMKNRHVEDELLHLVGLQQTHSKKVKDFSLGMKQRLGIAIALLNNPELLILDEPINGLDPAGVVEIRNLLKDLCKTRSITILISSHNLPELYQTATQYLFIHQGKLIESLSSKKLAAKCETHLLIESSNSENLLRVLKKLQIENYQVLPDKRVKINDYLGREEEFSQLLIDNGIVVTTFVKQEETLENYFFKLIGSAASD